MRGDMQKSPTSLTGRWQIFRAMWPPMNCMMVPSAFFPLSIIAATSGSSMTSWITIPPTMISGPFWGVCTRPWWHATLTLCGVTTDGSALYPAPLREVFGKVRHQICQFHIVAEVNKAILGAVASARKGLAAQQPNLRKGRPSTPAAKQAARTKKRLAAQRAALFTHRYLFVQRHLNKTERKLLWRSPRGLPQLHALRAIMEQVYALFDRRCRPQTALDKLAKLRRRVQRFTFLGDTLKKLFAPTLEKALTFLDDTLLPSTPNAVERGNRRYRKMQKHVYRVRTQVQIRARWALDMWREAQAEGRQQTLASLHQARAG